eukprot:362548-Chlamydomonas_euryale.AAC.4
MAVVCEDVRAVRIACALVQVVVLLHEPLQLALHVGNLASGEFKLVQRHAGLLEELEEAELLRHKQQQRAALPVLAARRAPHSVDVLLGVVRRVVLDDPVDRGDVEAACRHVCAQQHALVGLAELKERRRALLLLLFPVDVLDGDVNIVEQFCVEFDGEGEQKQEALVCRHDAVALLQALARRICLAVVNADVERLVLE